LRRGAFIYASICSGFAWHNLCDGRFRITLRAAFVCDSRVQTKQTNNCEENSMKLNQLLKVYGVAAALALSAGNLLAQDNNGGGGGGRQRGGGGGGFGGGGGNFDPAEMQQRIMDNIREQLGFTAEADWTAVQPLVQKVMDAQREVPNMGGRMMGGRGGRGGGGGGGGRGGGLFGATPLPEQEALQRAIEDNAPAAQIKDALAKYKTALKARQAKLEAAQADLKKVLSVKQEAQATLLGLVQ
jgi:hypothetical protein